MSLPSQQVIAVSAKASHWGGEQHPYYLIAAAVRHCLTVSGFRMLFVARRIEHPLDVKVQRPQHTDPRGLFLSSFEGGDFRDWHAASVIADQVFEQIERQRRD